MDAITIIFVGIIVLCLLVFRFVWKNTQRGILGLVVFVVTLWLLRTFAPAQWDRIIQPIKSIFQSIWPG